MEGPRNKTSPSQEEAERWGWFLMPWAYPPPMTSNSTPSSLGALPPCVFPGAFTSATWKSTEGTWVTLEPVLLCDLCPVCSGPFGAPASSAVNQGQKNVLLGLLKGRLRARWVHLILRKAQQVLVFPLTVEPLMEGATRSWSMLVRVPGTDAAGWP